MGADIQIVSGFLGAGKTTFLNSYLPLLEGKTVVIENEAGTVGVDGALLPKDYPVRELSSGCICCTLAPVLQKQLAEIEEQFEPDSIVIEPSGVGNLSDIVHHCQRFGYDPQTRIAMVDASEFQDYAENFGTFYMDQINNASLVLLTHTQDFSVEELESIAEKIRETNSLALIQTSDWRELNGDELLALVKASSSPIEVEYHHHHHDHGFENNGFKQVMFTNLKEWDENSPTEIANALNSGDYGEVYRAKGFVTQCAKTIYFDFTPKFMTTKEMETTTNVGELRFIVIGKDLNIDALGELLSN